MMSCLVFSDRAGHSKSTSWQLVVKCDQVKLQSHTYTPAGRTTPLGYAALSDQTR